MRSAHKLAKPIDDAKPRYRQSRYLLRSPSVRLCVPLRSCPEGATRSERDAPSGPLWGPLCSLPRRGPFGHILLLPRRGNDVIYADTFPAPKGAVCARPFGPLRGNILTKKTRYSILEDPPAPKGAVCATRIFLLPQRGSQYMPKGLKGSSICEILYPRGSSDALAMANRS